MKTKTKILIVEYDPNDVSLIERELGKGKIDHTAHPRISKTYGLQRA